METKDRTQASYNLIDINEQTRIAFEKCKKTKEQKIERLNKTIQRNQLKIGHLMAFGTDKQIDKCWKEIEQAERELKELENGKIR